MKNMKQKLMSAGLAGVLTVGTILASHNQAGASVQPDRFQIAQTSTDTVQVFPAAILAGALVGIVGWVSKELYEEGMEEGAADARKRRAAPEPVKTDKLRHGRAGVLSLDGPTAVYASLLD